MTLIKAENRELTHSRYSSTKGIPTETTGSGTGLLLGTDFRHAVEFSRSGRAAIRPSRAFVTGGLSNHTSHSDVPRSGVRSGALPGRRGAWRTVHEAFGSRRGPSAGPALSDVEHNTGPPPDLPVTAATCVSARLPDGGRPIRSPSDRGHNAAVARALPAPCDQRHGENPEEPQATPRGRNWTLTRGPTGLAVLGMQCSQVRWQDPPITTRSP